MSSIKLYVSNGFICQMYFVLTQHSGYLFGIKFQISAEPFLFPLVNKLQMLISVQQKRRLRQHETDMPKYLLNKLQKWNKKPVYFQANTEQDCAEFQINSSICWKSNLVQAYYIRHLYSAIRCWIGSEDFIFCSFCVHLHICSLLNHSSDPNSTWRTWTKWWPWADAPPTPQHSFPSLFYSREQRGGKTTNLKPL